MRDLDSEARLEWFTSTYSGNDLEKTNCVEVAFGEAKVFLRDSKDPKGGMLAIPWDNWPGLLAAIRQKTDGDG
ncbi:MULTISPECIES: DUF397 domain-containing protein [Amycolatopsis]|uniref:DUF397 domain-containing protein n=1 Tax=Amycolatopsis albidoflavus TaxID=102226 RepID=A0ABW5HTI1_9PSEU